jgi:hypothetical protein
MYYIAQNAGGSGWPLSARPTTIPCDRLNNMRGELVAPCGMNCGVCASYLAGRYDLNTKGFHRSYCAGCRPRGKNCTFMSEHCDLVGKGLVNFCYECGNFPCRRLKALDKRYRNFYHMSMIENLLSIEEHGIQSFLEKEEEKWKCPECGGVISCHNGICFHCHPDDLKNRMVISKWRAGQPTVQVRSLPQKDSP